MVSYISVCMYILFLILIFLGTEAVLHKTFHSYTVRSKQGGTQSSKDGKGSHPKSSGASLRRYNEQSHLQVNVVAFPVQIY